MQEKLVSTAISYLRWSTPEQEDGDSQKRQEEMVKSYCVEKGITLIDTKIERGVSAFRSKNSRKGGKGKLAALMDDLKSKRLKVDFVLVESLDRLSRDAPFDARQLLTEIMNTGVTIVTLTDRQVYSRKLMRENPVLSILMDVIMMRSQDESITKKARAKGAWTRKREAASELPITGNGPAWLVPVKEAQKVGVKVKLVTVDWKVDTTKAAVVRQIYDMAYKGSSIEGIAKHLNGSKVPPITGTAIWHRQTILRILKSKAVIGIMEPQTVDYVRNPDDDTLEKIKTAQQPILNYFPAIIDTPIAEKVWQLNKTRSAYKGTGRAALITSGLGKCESCGRHMTFNVKGANRYTVCAFSRSHACTNSRLIKYGPLEGIILGSLPEILDQHSPKGEDVSVTDLKMALEEVETEIGRLIDAIKIRGFDGAIGNALNALEQDRKRLTAEMSEAGGRASKTFLTAAIQSLKNEVLSGSSIPDINQTMRLVFKSIIIHKPKLNNDDDENEGYPGSIELVFADQTRTFIALDHPSPLWAKPLI